MGLRPELLSEIDTRFLNLVAQTQNAWAELDCSQAPPLQRCDADHPCPESEDCIYPQPGDPGYCDSYYAGDDEQLVPTGYGGGECVRWLSPRTRAALCCSDVGNVDCSLWPPTAPRGPGEICTDHTHCERGLLCVPVHVSDIDGYGRCGCPEAARYEITDGPGCWQFSDPPQWGMPALALSVGDCVPAVAEGYVQEVLTTIAPAYQDIVLRQDAQGYLYALHADRDALHILTDRSLDWPGLRAEPPARELSHWTLPWSTLAPQEEIANAPFFAWDFAADGSPHLAFANEGTVFVLRVAGEGWESKSFLGLGYANTLLLNVAPSGSRLVVFSEFFAAEDVDGGWTISSLLVEQPRAIVRWPGDELRIVSEDGFLEPTRQLVTPHAGLALSPVVSGGDLLTLSTVERALVMERVAPVGNVTQTVLWSHQAPSFRESELWDASLALDAAGDPLAVHRTPDGLALTERGQGDAWQSTVLIADRGAPHAIIDRAGKLQVFVSVDGNWDRTSDQLRRVRAGTCE
jgi:hypothetical protein